MHFREEETANFIELFNEVHPLISSFPGCSRVQLLRDINTPEIFFTYSNWQSEQDLENYRNSELFANTWKRTKVLFAHKAAAWSVEDMGY